MSYYLKSENMLFPTKQGSYDIRDALPVGTYTVGCHPEKGWYLKSISDFAINSKIYGKTAKQADRILNTFSERPNATGVLLNGEKGSGKTMLAKLISQMAGAQGISTIVINTPFNGDGFNTFIQEIDEPCVIVFDEFEKVFNKEEQEGILTLLDGVYPTKKLFILTVNDKYSVSNHMRNRPGRIFYMIEYKGVDPEFIKEYCEDTLDAKEHIQQIIRIAMLFDSFNFDMLKALVEEMNRYKETPNAAMEMLNAKPFDSGDVKYHVSIYTGGKKVNSEDMWPKTIRGNPVSQDEMTFNVDLQPDGSSDEDQATTSFEITQNNLKKIDSDAGILTYVLNEDKSDAVVFEFTREKKNKPNWMDAL